MSIKRILQASLIVLTATALSCMLITTRATDSLADNSISDANLNNTTLTAASMNISVYKEQNSSSNSSSINITEASTDSSYDTTIDITSDDSISVKADRDIFGIYIIWGSEVSSYTVSYNDKTIECGTYGYLHDYIPIEEGTASVSIQTSSDMALSDIYAYSKGTLPSSVQVWQPPCDDDTDILVFSTHADDEILFLGAILTNYGGQQKLNVQVAYMCDFFLTEPVRQHEELDGLWECGIKNYPVKGNFKDLYSLDFKTAMTQYNYDDIVSYVTSCIRRFKPLVCVSQDFNGEYGHGGHCVYAKAISDAVYASNSADFNQESADIYGIWDVPKTYYHLYNENTITIDVDSPLSSFDGRTSVEVLKAAFQKHVSQVSYSFNVMDNGYARTYWGNYDSRAFGLYRTTVGYDTTNNMMENVTSMRTEREAKKAEAKLKAQKEQAQEQVELSSQNTDNADPDDNSTANDDTHTLDTRQLVTTLIAIFIIGIVICGQAYRTRNLYKKKYDENKGAGH